MHFLQYFAFKWRASLRNVIILPFAWTRAAVFSMLNWFVHFSFDVRERPKWIATIKNVIIARVPLRDMKLVLSVSSRSNSLSSELLSGRLLISPSMTIAFLLSSFSSFWQRELRSISLYVRPGWHLSLFIQIQMKVPCSTKSSVSEFRSNLKPLDLEDVSLSCSTLSHS